MNAKEGNIIFKSLLQSDDFDIYINKYNIGVSCLNLKLDTTEIDIVTYLDKYPKLFSIINTGIALFKKDSNLHKRFVLAASLVESTPKGLHKTLNQQKATFAFINFGYVGIKALFNITCAHILFTINEWK